MNLQTNSNTVVKCFLTLSYLTEVLIVSLTFTFALFGVLGYSLSLYIHGFNINIWSALLVLSFTSVTSGILIYDKNKPENNQKSISAKHFLLKILPFSIFIPGLIAGLFLMKVQMGTHGAFHTGYVNQILQDIIPPENVALPGFPANVYWLYHALIASIVNLFNIFPMQVSSAILNTIALIGSLYWTNRTLFALKIKNREAYVVSFYVIFVLFAMNLFGPFHTLVNQIDNPNSSLINFWTMDRLNPVLGGDKRLSSLYVKFLNFHGAAFGDMYYVAATYYAVSILNDKFSAKNIILLILCISGALAFHTITGVYLIIVFPIALLISIAYSNRKNLIQPIKQLPTVQWALVFISAIVLLGPIFHYIYLASKAFGSPAETPYKPFASILAVAYPLIIAFITALYFRFKSFSKFELFLLLATVLGFSLSTFLQMPGSNEYKFIYLPTITLSALVITMFDNIYFTCGTKFKIIIKGAFIISLISISITIIYIAIVNIVNPSFRITQNYRVEGRHLNLKDGVKNYDAYKWLRDNTDEHTIVIIPLEAKDFSHIYTVAERLPYVVCGDLFSDGYLEYRKRVQNVMLFYNYLSPPGHLSCGHIPALRTKRMNQDVRYRILEDFKNFSSEKPSVLLLPKDRLQYVKRSGETLELLFEGKDSNIYRFKQ